MTPNEIAALPKGWEIASLDNVIELKYGKGLTKSSRDGGSYAVYGSNGVVGSHSNFLIEKPCLVVGRKGSIGEVHLSKQPCWPIDTTYYIDEFYEQPIKFWFYRLKALPLEQLDRASAIPGLNREDAYKLPIALPPLNEQCRIVTKIEALKSRTQQVKEALETIPLLLNQFRQSVLAAAFRGDLTADWREKNPDVEPASVLLERIRAERRRRWEEAELEKMKASGKMPKDDKWKKKYEEPQLEEEALPNLPNGWCWLALDLVADAIDPQPSHRTPPEVPEGLPYVSIGDIRDDETIDFDGARKVSPDVLKEHRQRYSLKEGDFIFGKIGTLGKPIKLPLFFDYTLSANVILIQPKSNLLMSNWLFYFMKSPFVENMLISSSRATSQAAFGIKRIRLMPIPLPPLQEQKQILLKLECYLLTAKKLVSLYRMSYEQIDILNQSILAKAFRGKLVPQDPNDEPASILLECIRTERANREAEAKATKKSTGKTNGRRSRKAQQQDSESIQLDLPEVE